MKTLIFFFDLIKGKPESLATSIYYFRREVTEKGRPQTKLKRNLNLRRGKKKTYPGKPRFPKTEKKFRDLVSEIVQPNVLSLIYTNKKWRDNFLFLSSCLPFQKFSDDEPSFRARERAKICPTSIPFMHKEEEEERKDIFSLHTPDTLEEEDEKTLFFPLQYEKEDTVTEIEIKAFSFWK